MKVKTDQDIPWCVPSREQACFSPHCETFWVRRAASAAVGIRGNRGIQKNFQLALSAQTRAKRGQYRTPNKSAGNICSRLDILFANACDLQYLQCYDYRFFWVPANIRLTLLVLVFVAL